MRIAFFDAKPYDRPAFDRYGEANGVQFKYFETKLNADTVELANGFDGVCVFVNDTVNATVIDKLVKMLDLTIQGLMTEHFREGSFQPEMLYTEVLGYLDMMKKLTNW